MANFAYTNNTTFKPFSFQEMLQPLAMYTEAHREVENAYSELDSQANAIGALANETNDPITYQKYKAYESALREQANILATQGLTPGSRKSLLDLKGRYAKDITPIQNAITRRRALQDEQRKALLSNPTLMFQRNFNELSYDTSLDRFLDNPDYDYGEQYSGALITKQVSDMSKHLAKELRGTSTGRLDDYTKTFLQKYGLSSGEVLQAINNPKDPKSSKALRAIYDSAVGAVPKSIREKYVDAVSHYASMGFWDAIGQDKLSTFEDYGAKLTAQANKELEVARAKAGLSGKDKTKTSNIDRTSYYFPKDRLIVPKILNEEGKLNKDNVDFLFKNGKFTNPGRPEELRGETKNMATRIAESDYYNKINNLLLNSGFSQEAINSMDRETIEQNLRNITELNAADALGRNIYRFALDEKATEHVIGKIGGRGLKVQELEGLGKEGPKYSDQTELEYEKGKFGDILFDAKTKDFLMLYNGHYYKLPKGMISNDFYNEIEGYLAEGEDGMSVFNRNQALIEAFKNKENLTEREQKALLNAMQEVYNIDTRLGTLGEEFVKYIGTKNTTN